MSISHPTPRESTPSPEGGRSALFGQITETMDRIRQNLLVIAAVGFAAVGAYVVGKPGFELADGIVEARKQNSDIKESETKRDGQVKEWNALAQTIAFAGASDWELEQGSDPNTVRDVVDSLEADARILERLQKDFAAFEAPNPAERSTVSRMSDGLVATAAACMNRGIVLSPDSPERSEFMRLQAFCLAMERSLDTDSHKVSPLLGLARSQHALEPHAETGEGIRKKAGKNLLDEFRALAEKTGMASDHPNYAEFHSGALELKKKLSEGQLDIMDTAAEFPFAKLEALIKEQRPEYPYATGGLIDACAAAEEGRLYSEDIGDQEMASEYDGFLRHARETFPNLSHPVLRPPSAPQDEIRHITTRSI